MAKIKVATNKEDTDEDNRVGRRRTGFVTGEPFFTKFGSLSTKLARSATISAREPTVLQLRAFFNICFECSKTKFYFTNN